MLREISCLGELSHVGVCGFKAVSDLDCLRHLPLGTLNLAGHPRHGTLSGIESFPLLTELNLVGFSGVQSLNPLASLRRLEKVGLFYCPRIEEWDALLQLPRLKSVEVFSGGKQLPYYAQVQTTLESRGIAVNSLFAA